MYTAEDIRQIAIQIEHNGEQTYRSAAQRATDGEVARILNWLADEERRHAKWFESLPRDTKEIPSEYLEMEALGRSLLKEMVENKTFSLEDERFDSAIDVVEILNQSLEFEQDTIMFYGMLKAFMEDQRGVAQLDLIINEEHGHVNVLKKLKDKFEDGADVDLSCIKTFSKSAIT